MAHLIKTCWIPPLGIFCVSLIILPLEMLPSGGIGPLNALIATSIVINALITGILQVYISQSPSSLELFDSSESDSESELSESSLRAFPPDIAGATGSATGRGAAPLPPT